MYEIGRLGYFHAPVKFLQIGSFGVHDVLEKVYITLIPILVIIGLCWRVKLLRGREKLYGLIVAVGGVFFILYRLSTSPEKQLFFLVAAVLCVLPGIRGTNFPEYGNEAEESEGVKKTKAQSFDGIGSQSLVLLGLISLLCFVFTAAGARDAAFDKYYWSIGNEVVLGFYGDKVLTSNVIEGSIGPDFFIKEIKNLDQGIAYRSIGPLRPAPRWEEIAK